ncbi:hypothetical protein Vi05172_g1284 [Venturia inaequalis]|nr:hypothetical protein Vi05172_g1284 [Venturia inaequalis]
MFCLNKPILTAMRIFLSPLAKTTEMGPQCDQRGITITNETFTPNSLQRPSSPWPFVSFEPSRAWISIVELASRFDRRIGMDKRLGCIDGFGESIVVISGQSEGQSTPPKHQIPNAKFASISPLMAQKKSMSPGVLLSSTQNSFRHRKIHTHIILATGAL